MKKKIDLSEYAGRILEAIPKGVLLNTKAEKFNSMVIGWGEIGTNWKEGIPGASWTKTRNLPSASRWAVRCRRLPGYAAPRAAGIRTRKRKQGLLWRSLP